MPLTRAAVGLTTTPVTHHVDARWLMSYAAALGDTDVGYLDTSSASGIVSHPLFAICPEWSVALASRDLLKSKGLTDQEFRRGVHATHDSHIYRLFRADEEIITESVIVGVEQRKPGAFVTTRFDSTTSQGELVCRSFNGTLFRGVEVAPGNLSVQETAGLPAPPAVAGIDETVDQTIEIAVPRNLAHIYTECARIFNPIHTDVAVAHSAGLPDFILHGSATLALAVSAIVRNYAAGSPERIVRISAQFRGMVLLPSKLTLRCGVPRTAKHGVSIGFDVNNADGNPVIGKGSIDVSGSN